MEDRPPEYIPSNHSFKGKVTKRPSKPLLAILAIIVVAIIVSGIVLSGVLDKTGSSSGTNGSNATIAVATGSTSVSAGNVVTISWTCSDTAKVGKIVYLYYAPSNQWPSAKSVISSTNNDGSYSWLVPSSLKGTYQVVVTSLDGETVGKSPVITIIKPSTSVIDPSPWVPDDTDTTPRVEPKVALSWQSDLPGVGIYPDDQYHHWNFGEPFNVVVRNTVSNSADTSPIANILQFPDLRPSQVSVTANRQVGVPLVVNMFDDGEGGCYGLMVDNMANIDGDKAWTWEYSSARNSYDVSINIIFYALGQKSFSVVAYDQDTGKRVDTMELTAPAHVWGRGLAGDTTLSRWDGAVYNPDATGVVHNYTLHDGMTLLAQEHYKGSVKDVVTFTGVSVRVWGIIDGVPILWNPNSEGEYEFYWENFDGVSSHEFHIQVQFLTPIPSEYGAAQMFYGVFDNSSGENLLGYFGNGRAVIVNYYP
ncbi:MAG: hypothetical protein ISF22_07010 [Methanomassiliicoccus sp.]|nr:hypothetical protein [Methanomassiliicoccus sp.]